VAKPLYNFSLSGTEQSARDRILTGEVADFMGAAEKPLLRASFLDSLAIAAPPRGIRVRGARIDGTLDLSDASCRRSRSMIATSPRR